MWKKHVWVGKEHVYDQELIYARIIGLLASSRDINVDDVFACELAAYPPSMYNPDEEMKISKSFKLYKGKMWRLCLTNIFPTASKPSRGCI